MSLFVRLKEKYDFIEDEGISFDTFRSQCITEKRRQEPEAQTMEEFCLLARSLTYTELVFCCCPGPTTEMVPSTIGWALLNQPPVKPLLM